MKSKVSIIIRTKNEGDWIKQCLSNIFNQNYKDFEIILVDNMSTDSTVKKASNFDINLVTLDEYLPGDAINKGIEKSNGDIIVILSGHCIPTNKYWLERLISNLDDKKVAGVYGRQEPLSFSSDSDKRDLAIVFGLDKKIQIKDSFIHNANSALRREIWEKFPFDSKIKHIEDRLWGEMVINAGYKIIYEPEASVFHYHGIHQNNHPERLKNVVKILEEHKVVPQNKLVSNYDFITIVPINEELDYFNGHSSLSFIADTIKSSKYLKFNKTIIASNITSVIDESKKLGFNSVYHRPPNLISPLINVDDIIKNVLMEYDFENCFPDAVIYFSAKTPYRLNFDINSMISKFIDSDFDALFPSYNEKRTVWLKDEKDEVKKYEKTMPTELKKGVEIAIKGLCTIAKSEYYLEEKDYSKIGLYELNDPAYLLESKSDRGRDLLENLLKKENKK